MLAHGAQGDTVADQDSVRVVSDLQQLDEILAELDAAAAVSDDELRRLFPTFRMELAHSLPDDPHSDAYRDAQFELYRMLAEKPYDIANEASLIDVAEATTRPFPFCTRSSRTVGDHLLAIGYLIRTMDLRPDASVLDLGAGWGNTSVWLARMGYRVTAVDIEPRFVELIRERSRRKELNVEVVQADFQIVQSFDRTWDAVLFFESFHHCADHRALVASLDRVVAPDGKVIFAAEPITEDFPVPWGLRLDGESLWSIRRNGWLELGFHEGYFQDLMTEHGWRLSKHVCVETPWGVVLVATRQTSRSEQP
jgi:2-polyprenyl-3-methyl-5-hydroxy-6-metoxy-1,4-benzoquinol methylase